MVANPPLDRRGIARALLEFGEGLPADGLIAIGPDPESDALIRSNGFAFLLGVLFDQGIRFERAWRAPYELHERLGISTLSGSSPTQMLFVGRSWGHLRSTGT
jgi:hypothetical protein